METIIVEWSHLSTTCAVVDEHHYLHLLKNNDKDLKIAIPSKGQITSISWSYHFDILAIGSSDNILTLFSSKTNKTTTIQVNNILKRSFSISKLFWNFFADQICLISKDNQLLILNIDEDLNPILFISLKLNFQIEKAVFFNESKMIISNKEGEIYLITKENQKYLTTILIPVHLIFCTKNRIISLSSDNIFTIFTLNEKNELKKLDQRKLNDGDFNRIEEMGNEELIYSIDDTIYIEKNGEIIDKMIIEKSEKIMDFHFYPYSNSLVAISEKGKVFIWSVNRGVQLINKLEINIYHIKNLLSNYSKAFLSINETDKSFSISKISKIRYINSGYFELMQKDSNTLISNSMNRIIKIKNKIEKIKQASNHFLIISDSRCQIFNFHFECINEFPIQTSLVEISGSRIFIMKDRKIDVRNFIDNSILNSIQIESSGSIFKTCLNGLFLLVLTTSNDIFVFDISCFSIKQISKLNISHLLQSFSVTSIGISNGGFCISFNCRSSTSRSKSILLNYSNSNHVCLNESLQLKWDTETPNLFCIRSYEDSLLTYLIDESLKTVQLKTLPFHSDIALLKVTLPRFFYSPFNSSFFSITSNFLPSFSCLDEASIQIKKAIVLLMIHVKNQNYESALKLIENIDDQITLNKFLLENKEIEFFSNLIQQKNEEKNIDSEVTFSELMHHSLHTGNISLLLHEVSKKNDQAMNWYGRFAEFKGDKKTAFSIYSSCQNEIDQVRILCSQLKFTEAKKIVDNTTDKSVICYFARLLIKFISNLPYSKDKSNKNSIEIEFCNETGNKFNEQNRNEIENSNENEFLIKTENENENLFQDRNKCSYLIIDLLIKAERYGMAFEFAVQEGFFDAIEKLSYFAPKNLVYKAARNYEKLKMNEHSIDLYFASGFVSKAVECAIKTLNIEHLTHFRDKIQHLTNFNLIYQCAEHFEKVGNYKEAVNFYAYSRCFEKVEELCKEKKLKISESLIEFLSSIQNESVARLLDDQGHFFRASQIYTELNQEEKALNSLIKSNDIKKIVQFTKMAKSQICYSISANYIVEKYNPKRNSPLLETVVDFFSKIGEYEKIANFYETRAKMEIDNGQNYEKAVELLKESQISIAKIDSHNFEWVERISNKIRWIEMYIEAASVKNPEIMEAFCDALLNTKSAFDIIRYEDVVFLQIQNFLSNEDFSGAQKLIEKLKEKGVDIEQFIESDSIKRIYRAATRSDPFDLSDEMPENDSCIIEHMSDS